MTVVRDQLGFGGGLLQLIVDEFASYGYNDISSLLTDNEKERALYKDTDIDLAGPFLPHWPAYEQGQRPTCVAFATCAMLELFLASKMMEETRGADSGQGKPVIPRLSPQFIYQQMRQEQFAPPVDKRPAWYDAGATRLEQARDVLLANGICDYDFAEYSTGVSRGDFVGPAPTNAAMSNAKFNLENGLLNQYIDGYEHRSRDDLQSIKKSSTAKEIYDHLAKGRPVAAAIPVFKTKTEQKNWHRHFTTKTGIVHGPADAIAKEAGITTTAVSSHVVCLTGFQSTDEEVLGGWFTFKNSWNSRFANQLMPAKSDSVPRSIAPGYGAISAAHVELYCWEYLCPIEK